MLNPYDKSLVEREDAIKGLQFLLQPDLLIQSLSDQVDTSVLTEIRTTYLRYKPGMNCIARFDFNGGVAYAKAFGENAESKLDKARQLSETRGPAGPGRVFLDESGIFFSFYPNDAELTSLLQLEDPATRAGLLARIFKTESEATWDNAAYTPLNYKPERRFVAKFTNRDGNMATVKFYTGKGFASIRRSRKKLNLPPGLTMPDWIGGSKGHRVMAFTWLPGETLHARLESGFIDESCRAGEAIARLHLSQQPALGKSASRDRLVVITSIAGQLGHLLPDLVPQASQLAKSMRQWWSEKAPVRKPVHGDFYAKQVIIQNTRTGIIDIDSAHLGNPVDDLGCFVAHLERRLLEGMLSAEQVGQVKAGLLQGYRSIAPGMDLKELNAYTAFNLYLLALHPFRDRRPDWPDETSRLLDRCSRLTQGIRR